MSLGFIDSLVDFPYGCPLILLDRFTGILGQHALDRSLVDVDVVPLGDDRGVFDLCVLRIFSALLKIKQFFTGVNQPHS